MRQLAFNMNSDSRFRLLRTLLLSGCLALMAAGVSTANAASIVIEPVYVQSLDAGFMPLGKLENDGAATPVDALLHYEFRLRVDDLAADEDFWIAIFNIELGPGLQAVGGWMDPGTAQANGLYEQLPSLANYDSNGAALGGIQAHWQFGNADFGVDANDLRSIVVEASGPEAANRQYGELVRPAAGSTDGLGSPTLIGAMLVRRLEMVPSSVRVTPIDGSPWGIYQGNEQGLGNLVALPNSTFTSGELELLVPEPSGMSLALGAAWLLVLWFRRRA
jgi:hypothetical protein